MFNDNKIVAELRVETGTGAMKRLRRTGMVPGVLNNSNKETVMLQFGVHDFALLLQHHVSETVILDLVVGDGEAKKVLLKEVQHDSVSGQILHADFQEISLTEKMVVPVSINLVGDPIGVTQDGGVLEHMLRQVEIECLPMDLVERIDVDVSGLKIGDSLKVSDIVVDSKLVVVTSGDIAVAAVSAPRTVDEEEAKEAAVAAAAVEGEAAAEGAEPAAEEKGKEKKGE